MEKLKFIKNQMEAIGIPYEFGEWTGEVAYPYFVGEITEEATTTEDGFEQATFMVTGFHRGKYIDLEREKESIRRHFNPISGLRAETETGTIAAFYEGAFYVPTGEADLKKIQINLLLKEWKGE